MIEPKRVVDDAILDAIVEVDDVSPNKRVEKFKAKLAEHGLSIGAAAAIERKVELDARAQAGIETTIYELNELFQQGEIRGLVAGVIKGDGDGRTFLGFGPGTKIALLGVTTLLVDEVIEALRRTSYNADPDNFHEKG